MKEESKQAKEYLNKFVTSTLQKCELFTKIYGKKFASERLNLNLDRVYIDEDEPRGRSYYKTDTNSITICNYGGNTKTPEEFKSTMLHESIHAIFKRTKLECLLYNIQHGTGIMERYYNNTTLGRGMNEGLTQWMVKKAGLDAKGYEELTNYIDILELAIGEDNVMQLGKGNIRGNVCKRLSMKLDECVKLLSVTDEKYLANDKLDKVNNIVNVLDLYSKINQLSQLDREFIEMQYKELENSNLYKKCTEDTLESKLIYFENMKKSLEEETNRATELMNEIVFDKYFRKDFKSLKEFNSENLENISIETLKKFDNLYKLMQKVDFSGVEYFKNNYEDFNKRYFNSICGKVEEKIQSGSLSVQELKEFENLVNRGREPVSKEFLTKISKIICPTNAYIAKELLIELWEKDELKEINEYSPIKIHAKDKEIIGFRRNGKIADIKEQAIDARNTSKEELFDFTLEYNEEEEQIIKSFSKIKEKVMKEDPNTTVRIINRLILIDNKYGENYYYITDGEIIPTETEEIDKFNLNILPDKPKEILPVVKKQGLFSRLRNGFKNMFSKDIIEPVYYEETKSLKEFLFRNEMKDFSKYDSNTTYIINNNEFKEDINQNRDDDNTK